ncbi:MFS transporter [Nocardiopsis lucentensis]|uniref:MFS transporter n=1 Tax=Nocardiopsis lucentensis TaxID=53441 RepID=UPI00034D6E57|nr:MFS transporter [Nocardiopsis lucentensis]
MSDTCARTAPAPRTRSSPNTRDDRRWRRRFGLLWTGGALSALGSMTLTLSVPLIALHQSGSPALAGWIAAAGMVPRTLLYVPLGVVVDRHDPRSVMVASQCARLACVALLVGPVLLLGAPVALLAAAATVHGVCAALHATAASAAVPLLVPRDHLPMAAARNEARTHATQMTGRPLGGALFGLGHGLPAVFDAAASAVGLCLVARLPRLRAAVRAPTVRGEGEATRTGSAAGPPEAPGRRASALFRETAAGFAHLRRDRFLLLATAVCAATNALFQTVWLVIVVLATEHGLSAFLLGAVLAATGAGGLLGSLTATALVRRLHHTTMVVLCLWAWVAVTVPLALAGRPDTGWLAAVLPLAWGGIGFVGAHMNVTVTTYHTTRVPPELLGRVTGTVRLATSSALPLGVLCGGHLLEAVGVRTTAVSVTALLCLCALVLTLVRAAGSDPPAPRPSPPPGTATPRPSAGPRPAPFGSEGRHRPGPSSPGRG